MESYIPLKEIFVGQPGVLQSYARDSHFPVTCTCMVLTIATLVTQIFNYVLLNIIISTQLLMNIIISTKIGHVSLEKAT